MRVVSVLIFILAGGAGTRLQPLTAKKCKPAVPFGGSFRVIDFLPRIDLTEGAACDGE